MSLDKKWASPQDFATLFQYFWYRDFPIDQKAIGAHRADWTIHIGIVVRNIADLMGLFTRFESGGRKDTILRGVAGDEIAIEWEWGGVWGNELGKLINHKVRRIDKELLKYTVFITYTHEPDTVCSHVKKNWETAKWPLLLILITVRDMPKKEITSGREFQEIKMYLFDKTDYTEIRKAPALPWKVTDTRWSVEHAGDWKQKKATNNTFSK